MLEVTRILDYSLSASKVAVAMDTMVIFVVGCLIVNELLIGL